MKVLIIGGSGLISTSITSQLLEREDEVWLYNRGKTPARAVPSGTLTGDRTNYAAFETQMESAGEWDCVVDMVGFQPADVESAIRAFHGRTKHYIFCSTVCVYGGLMAHYPVREDQVRKPISGYGQNKTRCEDILLAAHQRGELSVTIIRPSHTYGEGGGLVHSLGGSTGYIDRLRKGKPIVVHGDGNSLWAACHIDDVARGFVSAMHFPEARGSVYNLTGEEWMTWNQYHDGVAEALNVPAPRKVHIPTELLAAAGGGRAGGTVEIFQFPGIYDNTAAHRDLGFHYNIPWVEGVRRTVAWLDANGRIENSDDDPFEDRLIDAWEKCGAALTSSMQ